MQELRREIDILRRVSADANIVQFYGAVLPEEGGPSPALLVMEYLAVRPFFVVVCGVLFRVLAVPSLLCTACRFVPIVVIDYLAVRTPRAWPVICLLCPVCRRQA